MGGEIRNARRTIGVGLAIAAPFIAAIYLLGTLGVLAVLRASDINASSGVMQAIAADAARFHIPALTSVAALLVTISCLGSVGAWMGAIARIPFVAGIDAYMPAAFGRMHPRLHSPVVALVVQAVIAGICSVLGQGGTNVKGAYDVLVGMTLLATFLPFVLLFATAIKLCAGRVPVVAAGALGLCTTLASIVLSVIPSDDEPNKPLAVIKVVGLSALLVAFGAVVYMRSKAAAHSSPSK